MHQRCGSLCLIRLFLLLLFNFPYGPPSTQHLHLQNVSSLKAIMRHAYFAFDNSVTFFFALQLHAAITGNVSADDLGLGVGSKLLQSLKQQVVTLASNKGVLKTVQSAAQGALRNGWVLLLPTPEERARALTELLIESKS